MRRFSGFWFLSFLLVVVLLVTGKYSRPYSSYNETGDEFLIRRDSMTQIV